MVSLGSQGGFWGLTVSPTNPTTNSWFKKRERERRDAASFLPPPHPPSQSSCLDSVKPPAVPAPGGRSIVGMCLKGSKRRAPRSDLVLQCLCSIPATTSHFPKTSLTHPLLAQGAWVDLLSHDKRKGRCFDRDLSRVWRISL